jgi:cytochrome c peroxidase
LGRFQVTHQDSDRGRFKTPSLRDVARTAPYMHDGSLATLRDVVEFYSRGGTPNPHLDEAMQPLQLTPSEVDSLVSFLEALNGDAVWEVK